MGAVHGVRSCFLHSPPCAPCLAGFESNVPVPSTTSVRAASGESRSVAMNQDRSARLRIISQKVNWVDAQMLIYGQMGNHFRLMRYTRRSNLSRLMWRVNDVQLRCSTAATAWREICFRAASRRSGSTGEASRFAFDAMLKRNPAAARQLAHADQCGGQVDARASARPPWLESDRHTAVEVAEATGKSAANFQDRLKRCADRPQTLRMTYRG